MIACAVVLITILAAALWTEEIYVKEEPIPHEETEGRLEP